MWPHRPTEKCAPNAHSAGRCSDRHQTMCELSTSALPAPRRQTPRCSARTTTVLNGALLELPVSSRHLPRASGSARLLSPASLSGSVADLSPAPPRGFSRHRRLSLGRSGHVYFPGTTSGFNVAAPVLSPSLSLGRATLSPAPPRGF